MLGPNIPSRRKPRRDPHIIIGTINVTMTPTFVVAPLRGNVEKANDVFTWADKLLASDPETRVIFMSPVSNTLARNLRALVTKYLGQALYVCKGESDIPSLDGILLHAVPHTSKQIALGFIPQHDNVYHRSSREMHGIKFDTLLIPSARYNDAESGESMYTIDFEIPKTIQARETDYDQVSIKGDKSFKMTPGWVTMLRFGQANMDGGAPPLPWMPLAPLRLPSLVVNAPAPPLPKKLLPPFPPGALPMLGTTTLPGAPLSPLKTCFAPERPP
jgi:hypothetical protein